jgi:hypothetical protein
MVKVKSNSGIIRNIEITGIAEIKRRIEGKTQQIVTGSDLGLLRIANFLQQELKESIIGNRAEEKSVDTGLLAKSITVDKEEQGKYVIYPEKLKYSGTDTTTQDVALYMEYGTSKFPYPRYHFKNTKIRNKDKIIKEIKNLIKV